ncbi:MAG TPA: hypothetical protein DCM34_04320 [Salmonella bongori]|uniref:Uncharacterized protein n=2 Tax=Salmonella bongori TaxID=54736 RepID=A0A248KBY5_SALBN|nr:hypothetical protein LFZ56_14110 [Salmonella bongori serovar 66:z41:- str. SA19983605]ECC8735065.1 hypothetical protein [Salmonella bongori]HAC6694412.1 hypothetical protein [Salmonella bongori serovar 44:r:-]ECC9752633.1 hypothetical protein [Salmonella bongori]ECE6546916.1 hypothetical protein [Salmonella bongori]
MAGCRQETRRVWIRWTRWPGNNCAGALSGTICWPDKTQQHRYLALALFARNKNASRSGWHFASWMYTMRQRSYATASASMGTMILA